MESTPGSSAAEALTASTNPEPQSRYKFRDTQARQARRAPAGQVHPTSTASRPAASRSKRKRDQNDDRGNAVAQPGAASRASKKPRLAIDRTKGRSTKSKGATKKKTKTPLKKADEAHKRAQEEKEKTVKREIAREERNERYERRRASAEERQRVQAQTAGTARSTPEERQPEASSPRPVSARDKGKGREVPTDDQGNASRQEGQAAAPVAASTCTSTSTSAFTSTSIFNSTSTSAPAPTFQGSVFGAETMARLAREEAPVPAPAPVQPGIQMSDATKARCIAMYRRKHGENTLQTEEEQQIVLAEIARRLYS